MQLSDSFGLCFFSDPGDGKRTATLCLSLPEARTLLSGVCLLVFHLLLCEGNFPRIGFTSPFFLCVQLGEYLSATKEGNPLPYPSV